MKETEWRNQAQQDRYDEVITIDWGAGLFNDVIDGDTIKIRGAKIRLHGIDAPESAQVCKAKEKSYRCGTSATLALGRRIAGKSVSCDERDQDRYGRIVAVCHAAVRT